MVSAAVVKPRAWVVRRVIVRPAEWESWQSASAAAGLTVGAWLRRAARDASLLEAAERRTSSTE